ncbi:unnamed protein product, partial [Ilex paraguariensis]
ANGLVSFRKQIDSDWEFGQLLHSDNCWKDVVAEGSEKTAYCKVEEGCLQGYSALVNDLFLHR